MNFDFEAILTLATLLSGLIWLLDAAWLARRRARAELALQEKPSRREPLLVEYARSFFPVLLIVLLLRSFVAEPFHIPSSSMVPTLLVKDFILVNKFDYGLRLPVLHTRILPLGEPQRGDVVVFRFPERSAYRHCLSNPLCLGSGGLQEVRRSAGSDYIKRVIGLPGDHIVYRDKTLYINGARVTDTPLGPYAGPDVYGALLSRERLGGVSHDILTIPGYAAVSGEWTVPQGQYFVMGDNRDNSFDSRYWGFVPERNLVGKAFLIWMNLDAFRNAALWHRVGEIIH